MLQGLRAASQSWLMRAFFAILVFAFVILWGVGDVFQPGRGGGQYVATVGKKTIGTHEFVRMVQSISRLAQMKTGQQPDENVIKIAALQNLIRSALLDQEAERLGIAVSDKQVRNAITSSPTFQDNTGQFNKQIFEATARAEGLSERELTEKVREQLKYLQLSQIVASGLEVPNSYAQRLFKWQNEKRKIDWLEINTSALKNIAQPTEEQIKAYFDGNAEQFTIPETRDITVLSISEDQLKDRVQLTDEEIQAGVAQRQDQSSKGLPSKKEIDQIVSELKAEKISDLINQMTTQIEDNLAAGISMEDIAKQNQLKIVTIDSLQRDGDVKVKPDVSQYAFIEIIEQAFTHEAGEEPSLTQLENGELIVVRLNKVNPSKLKPLEEAKTEAKDGVLVQLKEKAAKDLAETLAKQINEGKALKQIGKENSLKLKSDVIVDRIENDDQKVSPYLRHAAFATEINKASIAPDKDGYAIVVPRQIIEADIAGKQDEVKAFTSLLENSIADDMQNEFLSGLQSRFPVEYNESVLKKLEQ